MDLNVVKRESDALRRDNDNLRRENEQLRNQSSVSPSTNDQKLVYYEKHLKVLEKERSELLSRATVAEEQVKNLLAKVGRAKG
jgi:coiled-coil domain-containing protein 78